MRKLIGMSRTPIVAVTRRHAATRFKERVTLDWPHLLENICRERGALKGR